MKTFLTLICILFYTVWLGAQIAPGSIQSVPILITGGTAHVGDGSILENAAILFAKGKIDRVARAGEIPITDDIVIIETTGHIYPGLIAPNTILGLAEIEQVRATRDEREIGTYNPNLRSIIAYNTDSDVTPTVRTNGVLIAQIIPRGGIIAGTSSIVQLDAWNWEDAAYRTDDGVHINWPSLYSRSRLTAKEKSEKYKTRTREIQTFFEEAHSYVENPAPTLPNLKMESMRGLFEGKQSLFIHVNDARSIMASVLFSQSFGVTPVIVGAREAYLITDFLYEKNVPIILGDTHALPSREDEDIDQPFKTANALEEAGILFAFSVSGFWEVRNLPFMAGQAVGFGLDPEKAIQAMTLNAAKILGIDQKTGSISPGKDANLIISNGDIMDMRSCNVTHAFIQGRKVDLDNKQKALYRKYKKKYNAQ